MIVHWGIRVSVIDTLCGEVSNAHSLSSAELHRGITQGSGSSGLEVIDPELVGISGERVILLYACVALLVFTGRCYLQPHLSPLLG